MSSRIGHLTRRHPLCPSCGYNLVATVAEHRRVCPECGEPFERRDLHRAVAPEDWTLMRGLRRAAPFLFVRVGLSSVAWTIGLVLLKLIDSGLLPWSGSGASAAFALVVAAAVAIGGAMTSSILARDLGDRLGFDGAGVALICIFAALVAIGLGVTMASLLPWPLVASPVGIMLLAGLFAVIPAARAALQEEF